MNVILLEKIRNLGDLGQQVAVKPGYARNYLYPKNKAIPATPDNIEKFETRRAELECIAAEALQQAQAKKATVESLTLTISAKAGEEGKLFGSVNVRDIAAALSKSGIEVERNAIQLPAGPIREVGDFEIRIILHTDVATSIKLSVIPE